MKTLPGLLVLSIGFAFGVLLIRIAKEGAVDLVLWKFLLGSLFIVLVTTGAVITARHKKGQENGALLMVPYLFTMGWTMTSFVFDKF